MDPRVVTQSRSENSRWGKVFGICLGGHDLISNDSSDAKLLVSCFFKNIIPYGISKKQDPSWRIKFVLKVFRNRWIDYRDLRSVIISNVWDWWEDRSENEFHSWKYFQMSVDDQYLKRINFIFHANRSTLCKWIFHRRKCCFPLALACEKSR